MNPLHYPDIERCRKLTQIRFPYSVLSYYQNSDFEGGHTYIISGSPASNDFFTADTVIIRCPSVTEMLDVISEHTKSKDVQVHIVGGDFGEWGVAILRYSGSHQTDKYLPNALADLIFWLVDNGHLTFTKQ